MKNNKIKIEKISRQELEAIIEEKVQQRLSSSYYKLFVFFMAVAFFTGYTNGAVENLLKNITDTQTLSVKQEFFVLFVLLILFVMVFALLSWFFNFLFKEDRKKVK